MNKFSFHCLYCDNKWIDSLWTRGVAESSKKCKVCEEKTNITVKELVQEEIDKDVFGYRFSPEFPKDTQKSFFNSWD